VKTTQTRFFLGGEKARRGERFPGTAFLLPVTTGSYDTQTTKIEHQTATFFFFSFDSVLFLI
jgi:hypothetical protein